MNPAIINNVYQKHLYRAIYCPNLIQILSQMSFTNNLLCKKNKACILHLIDIYFGYLKLLKSHQRVCSWTLVRFFGECEPQMMSWKLISLPTPPPPPTPVNECICLCGAPLYLRQALPLPFTGCLMVFWASGCSGPTERCRV